MKIVYTDPAWAIDNQRVDSARAAVEHGRYGSGVELHLGQYDGESFVLEGPAFEAMVSGADALVVYRCQVTDALLDIAGDGCKIVARQGVGIDNLNVPVLARRGVSGFHVPDYCVDEVTAHALGLLLALERGICVQDRLVKEGAWGIHERHLPRRLSDVTVGIVGFGRLGRASARKLGVVYGAVAAYDPYVSSDLMVGHGVQPAASLEELFATCGAVVIHAELNDETRGLIGESALAACRPGTYLVNVARGGLVQLGAVVSALDEGRLGGFASDVFTPENPHDSDLGRALAVRDDVIVSCHRAFLSEQAELRSRARVADAVRRRLEGASCTGTGWLT